MYFKVQGRSVGNQLNRKNPSLIRIYYIDKIAAMYYQVEGQKIGCVTVTVHGVWLWGCMKITVDGVWSWSYVKYTVGEVWNWSCGQNCIGVVFVKQTEIS